MERVGIRTVSMSKATRSLILALAVSACAPSSGVEAEPQLIPPVSIEIEDLIANEDFVPQNPMELRVKDACSGEEIKGPLINFDSSGFFDEEEEIEQFTVANDYENSMPELSPHELAAHYIETRASSLDEGLQIAFDESIDYKPWDDGDTAEATYSRVLQKLDLIRDIDDLIEAINDYPPGLFAALGLNTVRFANAHDSEGIGGHYDGRNNEVVVEYDAFKGSWNPNFLHNVIAHEVLGHAAHDTYCDGLDYLDAFMGTDVNFLGFPDLAATAEDYYEFYSQNPMEMYEYGPERVFPRFYGAVSVTEYVATIAEFTTQTRGRILPGDDDYGSKLQKEQAIFIDRMEKLFPGFSNYIDRQTANLRMDPDNEVNTYRMSTKFVFKSELEDKLAVLGENESLVFNGIVVNQTSSPQGNQIFINPVVTENLQDIEIIVGGNGGAQRFIGFRYGDNNSRGFDFFHFDPSQDLFKVVPTDSLYQEIDGVPYQESIWTTDANHQPLLQDLATRRLGPCEIALIDEDQIVDNVGGRAAELMPPMTP